MKIRTLIAALLFLSTSPAIGQELNGIWKGTLTQQPGGCFPVYHVELQVSIKNNQVSGFCYHYSDISNYVKKNYNGIYNAATKTINIQEQRVMTFHIPPDCTPCIRYFTLTYSKQGKEETLAGDWGGVVMNGSAACTPGRIVLHRVAKSEFDHIQEIRVDTGTLRLDFYDNAEVDGDSITVTVNNEVKVSNQRLGLKPVSVDIKVDLDHQELEVTMIGENLGTIPPNTALLIVTAGKKRYQLFLASNGKKNAQVRFIYEKPGPE
ncbi:MAG TPA: hypothetical protein VFR58_17605 [Flavisolibacter sp.]|nr:hypothetical protein [Flavisolibacter sp.]